ATTRTAAAAPAAAGGADRCNALVKWTKSHSAPIAPALVSIAPRTGNSPIRPGSGAPSPPPSPPRPSSRRLGQLSPLTAASGRRTALTPTVPPRRKRKSSVIATDFRGEGTGRPGQRQAPGEPGGRRAA